MFENLCTLPLNAELFAQALHPSESLLAVGLASGHVQCFGLPSVPSSAGPDDYDDAAADASMLSDGKGTIDTIWQTRRHKGSCRCLGFSPDGSALYSGGADGIVKHFSPTTGQVASKFLIPRRGSSPDAPTLLLVSSPQTILLGTDAGALHIVDMRQHSLAESYRPASTHLPHSDFVSSVSSLPPSEESTSGFSKQWISTGATTLAVTDLRRGVMMRSEDQEDELLSSVLVPGLGPKKNRQQGMCAVGTGSGVLTLWDKGAWDDQTDRITVSREGESIDCVARIPDEVTRGMKRVACGMGDGSVHIVDLQERKLDYALQHDALKAEAITGLGFDCFGRMISGCGTTIKVWQEGTELNSPGEEEMEDDISDEPDDGSCGRESALPVSRDGKRQSRQESAPDSDSNSDSDSDGGRKRRRKRKHRKGKAYAALGPHGAHGVLKFKGLS